MGVVSTNGALKQAGKKLFAPEHGGSYWKERPLRSPVLVEYAALDVVVLHAMKGAWMKYSPLNLNNLESDRWAPAREGRRWHDAGLMPAQGRQMALQDGVARLVMRDLADAILANMPVGYRLLIQRVGPGFPAIFEAKAVAPPATESSTSCGTRTARPTATQPSHLASPRRTRSAKVRVGDAVGDQRIGVQVHTARGAARRLS